jgi:hypothetical protein
MSMKGGNTESLYSGAESTLTEWTEHAKTCDPCRDEQPWKCDRALEILEPDGRWRMALSLLRQHPDVTAITRKWGRWQHNVDYSQWHTGGVCESHRGGPSRLIPAWGAIFPEGRDNYGMLLRIRAGTEPRRERSEIPAAPDRPVASLPQTVGGHVILESDPGGKCSRCQCSRVEMPTECPGKTVWSEERDEIRAGRRDYRGGTWTDLPQGGK